jgi:hypothetical protein
MKYKFCVLWILLSTVFCTVCTTPQVKKEIPAGSDPVVILQRGDFYLANTRADEILSADSNDANALLVRAISQYIITTRRMGLELMSRRRSLTENDITYIRFVFQTAEADFARIQSDFDKALKYKDLSIVLTPSSWESDWNMDGDIDSRDRELFQIEYDENGEELDDDDPRRNPTYRFDYGDILWASAYIHFQRAALDLVLAYNWSAITRFNRNDVDENGIFVIKLIEPKRMTQFREQLLLGLDSSNKSRIAYLAETDDDREWIPNPSQKSHPMPMKLDKDFYTTWESLIKNLTRIAKGEDVLDPASAFGFLFRDKKTTGYINFGDMISHPKDIELNIQNISMAAKDDNRDELCKELLGKFYIFNAKNISPISKDLMRMSGEIQAGSDNFTNKLKYLVWVN